MIVVGETGLVRWSVAKGPTSAGDIDVFVEHLRTARSHPGLVLLDISQNITAPSSASRRAISDAVLEHVNKGTLLAGHAVVSDSFVARGIMIAVAWLTNTPSPWPEQIFSDPATALAWAKELSPGVDVDAVHDAWRREVPWYQEFIRASE